MELLKFLKLRKSVDAGSSFKIRLRRKFTK